MKVLMRGPYSPYSGYGSDLIGMTRAFMRLGADVYVEPTEVQAPLPEDVALLLTKELVAPFDLVINHVDPSRLSSTEVERANAETIIGWTMWEYTSLANLKGRSKLKKNLKNFDALVGYDQVSSACLEPYFKKPILTVQGGFDPEDYPEVERDWNERNFYFCMLGQLSVRKDPFVAIQAFSQLKEEYPEEFEPARLSLKTVGPGLHHKMEDLYPGLRIYYDNWPADLVKKFYASQHVLLAPSRGEGKNLPALEFQSTGGVVVATNWGGHTQWLNPAYSYPLDYTLEPVDLYHAEPHNARASVDHLKSIMLHLFRNRDEARQKGALAARVIPALASWDGVLERLMLRMKEELPTGERLWLKYQIALQGADHGDS